MNKARMTNTAVFAVTALLHIALISLLWQAQQPVEMGVGHMEVVDLGDFGGGGIPEGAAAVEPAPEPQPPKSEVEQPKRKPVESAKSVIKPVVTKKTDADIRQPKEKNQPAEQPKPEPKPVERTPEPESESKPEPKPAAEKTAAQPNRNEWSRVGGGTDKEGSQETKGGGEGGGRGSGGVKGGQEEGTGGGAGSSRSNPIKATGSIPTPPYPPLAQENGEEGTVGLSVLVAPGGRVVSVSVVKSSGSARLDKAARNAAKKGSFNAAAWTDYKVSVRFAMP